MSDDRTTPTSGADAATNESPWFDLAAAYALDALDETERVGFERELARSNELQARVDEFREALVPVADDLDVSEPPASLKADLFARLGETSQVAPVTASRVGSAAPHGGSPAASRMGSAEQRAQHRWFQRPAAIIASAAAVVALISGAVVGVNWGGENGWGAQSEMRAIESADDSSTAEFEVAGGGSLTLVSSASAGRSAVVAEDMPDPGTNLTYELWYIDDSGAIAAGTFDPVGGEGWRVLEGPFEPGVIVGVTVEPEGGSEQPTTDPIALVET